MVASFFPSLQSSDMSLNGFLFHLILHSKIMLLSLTSAGHMFCIKWLHLCATLLNMHPSSEYYKYYTLNNRCFRHQHIRLLWK